MSPQRQQSLQVGGKVGGQLKSSLRDCGKDAAVSEIRECRRTRGTRSQEHVLKGFSRDGMVDGWAGRIGQRTS